MYVPSPINTTERGAWVKEQYVGDINDYRKYALLRRLQNNSRLRLGVCWMLTPSDGSRDGGKLRYLEQPSQERHDSALYRVLRAARDNPDGQRLKSIESSGALCAATFFDPIVPDLLTARTAWFQHALTAMADADFVFFDPDNGLDVRSKPKGRVGSSKYVYRDEVASTYQAGRSVLIYQHFPRSERVAFVATLVGSLRTAAPKADAWAIHTSNVAFLLLIHPDHHTALHAAAQSVSTFDPTFLKAEHYPTP